MNGSLTIRIISESLTTTTIASEQFIGYMCMGIRAQD